MQAEKQDEADTDPNVENKVNAPSDTDPLRQLCAVAGNPNEVQSRRCHDYGEEGDCGRSPTAYRRIPPNRIERMNCAIIEQSRTTMPLHGGQFRPHTVEPRRNSASINQGTGKSFHGRAPA